MKTRRVKSQTALRPVNEDQKPKLVANLESAFPGMLYDPDAVFDSAEVDIHLMFDAINDAVWQNKLGRNVAKTVVDVQHVDQLTGRYRDVNGMLAGYFCGMCKGEQAELIIVKHPHGANFFQVVNSLLHEMIHMYDHNFGPLHGMFEKHDCVPIYNFNTEFKSKMPDGSDMAIKPKDPWSAMYANLGNAGRLDLKPGQLPAELKDTIDHPEKNDMVPRQYSVPGEMRTVTADNPRTGRKERFRIPAAQPRKFEMGAPDGFYDLHGNFFKSWAKVFNGWGFCVLPVSPPPQLLPRRLLKTYESGADAAPRNIAEAQCRLIKCPGKEYDYRDEDNWYVMMI